MINCNHIKLASFMNTMAMKAPAATTKPGTTMTTAVTPPHQH